MSLQGSGAMSDAQVMAEIRSANPGRAYPLGSNDADLLALAGKASPPLFIPADLYGKGTGGGGGGAISATGNSDTGSMAGNTTGISYTGHASPSVSAAGGSAPYSYLWSITSGSGFALTNATAATCDVAHSITPAGYTGTCTLQCVVRDSATPQNSTTVSGIQAVFVA